jgi:hypothetical protein
MLLEGGGLRYNGNGDPSGAQTERRGGAGPVRGLLGGKDLTGRFFSESDSLVASAFNAKAEHADFPAVYFLLRLKAYEQ